MFDPDRHIALAIIDREWPGRYLAVTEGYRHVYRVPVSVEEMLGQTIGDVFPGVMDPEHPWGQSWRERFTRALAGEIVGDADPTPGDDGVAAFVVVPCLWEGKPAFLIRVMATTFHIQDTSLAIAQAVLDPAGERLGVSCD